MENGTRRIIARLNFQRRPVDGAAIQPRRRAGLQSAQREAEAFKRSDKPSDGGASPTRPAGIPFRRI